MVGVLEMCGYEAYAGRRVGACKRLFDGWYDGRMRKVFDGWCVMVAGWYPGWSPAWGWLGRLVWVRVLVMCLFGCHSFRWLHAWWVEWVEWVKWGEFMFGGQVDAVVCVAGVRGSRLSKSTCSGTRRNFDWRVGE